MTKTTKHLPAILTTETIDGVPIVFREDGYINVTKVCQNFKKRANDFLALPSTIEYMEALAEALNTGFSGIAFTKRGGAPGQAGTWLHPKMAVSLMRWLDVPFSVRADLLIDNILRGSIGTTVLVP